MFIIVTSDETWLYYYDVSPKSKSRSIIKTIILETQLTVTSNWYIEHCLLPFVATLKHLHPKSQLCTWFLRHNNAPAQRAQATTDFIKSLGITLLEHPAYSPYLTPWDFELFPYVKNQLH